MKQAAGSDHFRFLMMIYGVAMLVMIVAGLAIPKGDDVLWINGHHSPFLDRFLSGITHFGEGWVFLLPVFAALFVRYAYAILGVSIAVVHGIVCSVLKRVIFPDLLRPTGLMDNQLLYFVPGVEVHTQFAFPSGHTATVFCAAVFASLLIGRRWPSVLFLLVGVLVAYSRVYLLQHFILDVAGGALVGVVTALIGWAWLQRNSTPAWMNQILQIRIPMHRATDAAH